MVVRMPNLCHDMQPIVVIDFLQLSLIFIFIVGVENVDISNFINKIDSPIVIANRTRGTFVRTLLFGIQLFSVVFLDLRLAPRSVQIEILFVAFSMLVVSILKHI